MTPLSEPETHGLMGFELFVRIGSVDKHIGDAVMALFGTPRAHGDDPCARPEQPSIFTRRWRGRAAAWPVLCKPTSELRVARSSPPSCDEGTPMIIPLSETL